jgi:hypothetical protein
MRNHFWTPSTWQLRAQGQPLLALVLEDVHLLLHDVGRLAHPAGEERRLLDGRRTNLAIAVEREDRARHALHLLPACDAGGEEVVHALHAGDLHRGEGI